MKRNRVLVVLVFLGAGYLLVRSFIPQAQSSTDGTLVLDQDLLGTWEVESSHVCGAEEGRIVGAVLNISEKSCRLETLAQGKIDIEFGEYSLV